MLNTIKRSIYAYSQSFTLERCKILAFVGLLGDLDI